IPYDTRPTQASGRARAQPTPGPRPATTAATTVAKPTAAGTSPTIDSSESAAVVTDCHAPSATARPNPATTSAAVEPAGSGAAPRARRRSLQSATSIPHA